MGWFTCGTSWAADAAPDHAIIAGFERLRAMSAADEVRAGKLLLGELNCTACHSAEKNAAAHFLKKQAPVLDSVGSRVRPEFLREFLASPHGVKPGTTMPDLFASADAATKTQQVEALVHFLALTGGVTDTNAVSQAVQRGQQLFHTSGCVACHEPRKANAEPVANSVPLGPIDKKYSIPGLSQFLLDPLAVRPSGRMPQLNLQPEEARDIASYFLKDSQAGPNLKYAYYEGNWDKLPDFSQLMPQATGVTSGFDVNVGRPDNFAIRFEGFIQIAKEGQYRFYLTSDDGSRLLIDGSIVVNNDNIHPPKTEVGRAFLTAGAHPLVVEFFEQGGGQEVHVEIEGNGIPRQSAEFALSLEQAPTKKDTKRFTADPSLAAQGKQLFDKLGCAACHQLGKDQQPVDALIAPPTLAKLKTQGGCLSAVPLRGAPHYRLNAAQRKSLAAAIEALRQPAAAPAGEELITQTLATFNCLACHQRGPLGGVTEDRNQYFTSNQPEMGDEGRLPPHLTGVGAKLNKDWLQQLFANGAKDRPYMHTRMPKFGLPNVGLLVEALERADVEPPDRRVAPAITEGKLKAAGRSMVGGQGFSCIKCHTWGNIPSTGIQSIGMTTMTRRLRKGWFDQYMRDPQVYRPGTRMPAAWPQGQVLLPTLLDGKMETQIHAIWKFLADGDKATVPQGLGRDPIELIAIDEPVIYRNFIEGAGPRAIGVGYPEKVNLAFDANEMRPALIWQGSFIDAQRHWADRGVGFQGPLGDNLLKLPTGAPLAVLERPDSPWPDKKPKEIGYWFRGYRLDEQRRPVFLYNLDDRHIEDHFVPAAAGEKLAFRRTLKITCETPSNSVWFRAANANKIEEAGGGWFTIDGEWRLRIEAAGKPIIRNGRELLVPVSLAGKQAQIVQEIVW